MVSMVVMDPTLSYAWESKSGTPYPFSQSAASINDEGTGGEHTHHSAHDEPPESCNMNQLIYQHVIPSAKRVTLSRHVRYSSSASGPIRHKPSHGSHVEHQSDMHCHPRSSKLLDYAHVIGSHGQAYICVLPFLLLYASASWSSMTRPLSLWMLSSGIAPGRVPNSLWR